MLNLEILENRLLLSVIIKGEYEDVNDPNYYTMDFGLIPFGDSVFGDNSITIENDGPDTITLNALNVTDPAFKVVPPDNLPITIVPGDAKDIKLGFNPWEVKGYTGSLNIVYTSSTTGPHVQSFDLYGEGEFREEGEEGEEPFSLDTLGDLTITDLTVTTSSQTSVIRPGDFFNVSVTVTNVGGYPTDYTELVVSYSDDPNGFFSSLILKDSLDPQDTLFVDQLAPGQSQTFPFEVLSQDMPDINGAYYILAEVDPRWEVPEYLENIQQDAPNHLASADALIFDLTYSITDTSGASGDLLIEFPDTGRGQVAVVANQQFIYDTHTVTITNEGNQTIEFFDLNIPGNDFSLQMPPRANLPGSSMYGFSPNDALPIALDQVVSGTIKFDADNFMPFDAAVYSFNAQQGDYITVEILSDSNDTLTGTVYTDHGEPVLPGPISFQQNTGQLSSIEFPAFYSGNYYLEVNSFSINETDYQLKVSSSVNPMPELFLSRQGDTYSNTLETNDLFGVGTEAIRFNAEYGDQIQIELQSSFTSDLGETLAVPNFWLFNPNGSYINLIEIIDADDVPGGVVAPDQPRIFEFTSYNHGDYYFYLQYFAGPDEQIDLELKIRETDNIFSLEPGEQVELPVWFTPQETGLKQDYLQFVLDTGIGDLVLVEVELAGEGLTGDYYITNIQMPDQLFPNQVQTGMPLNVSGTVHNWGKVI